MSALSIQPTFPIFTDIDGQPLEAGYVWIGTANLDPQTNPINVYWDAALTIAAVQPIRTLAGYPSNSGTPARLYVNSDYSIRVMNKNGSTVYSAAAATERYSDVVVGGVDSSEVSYLPAGTGAVATTVQTKLRESVSVKDFGAVGDGVTDDTEAIQAAFNYIFASLDNNPVLHFGPGVFLVTAPISLPLNFVGLTIKGSGKRNPYSAGSNQRGSLITFTGVGTLFPILSGMQILFEDIGFAGLGSGSAQTAIKFTQPGNGSGMSSFVRTSFNGFSVGVQFANALGDGGCADVGFDFVEFSSCDYGVKVVNTDGANYSFNRLYASSCNTIISSVPGSFNIKNAQIVGCGSGTRNAFEWTNAGDGAGFILIDGIRIEQNTQRVFSVQGAARFHCIGLDESQNATGQTTFLLTGVDAKIELSRFFSMSTAAPLAVISANTGTQRSRIVFEQCYFNVTNDADLYKKIIGFINTGFVNSYRVKQCTAGSFMRPCADMGGRALDGEMYLTGQTLNATPIELTVNGDTGGVQTRVDTQYSIRCAEFMIQGSTGSAYCCFTRRVVWSSSGVLNTQTIGTDLDTIGSCSVSFPSSDGAGLRVQVTGPAAATCDWRAAISVVPMGYL